MKNFQRLKIGVKPQKFIAGFSSGKMLSRLMILAMCYGVSFTTALAADGDNTYLISNQQEKTITGTVKDTNGEPLPGVAIVIQGTTIGTITDIDGNFTLGNVPEGAVIEVSFIGMTTKVITVGTQSKFDVVLENETIGIDEVVAIGYTVRKKGEVTGSVASVSSETLERSGNKDVAKSLAGKVPGLIISDRGGYPGSTGDMNLLIRGKGTLNNNNPLILIDGIPTDNFSYLSPQDMESLVVLKDGAAAIYGARAANGVILITTKRGKSGKPKVNVSSSYTLSQFSVRPTLMSSEQFAIYDNENAAGKGGSLPYSDDDLAKIRSGEIPNTNWADKTFADFSPESRTMVSISGGSENVNYFVSGDYIDQVGMYKSGDLTFNQYQVRSNLDIKLYNNFKLGVDLSGRVGKRSEPGVDDGYIFKHIYVNLPTNVAEYDNGLPAWGGENGANPMVMSSSESGFVKRDNNDLRAKFSYDWDLTKLLDGLRVKGFAGIRKTMNDTKSWYTPWIVYSYQEGSDEYVPQAGYSQRGNEAILRETYYKYNELMLNTTVHYDHTFGDHTVRGFVGVEQTTSNQRTFWAERKSFPSKDHPELFAGGDEGQGSFGEAFEWGRLNFFGAASYDFQKKYFIDLTLRHDGSSAFGPGKRFGTFPGAAVSWSIGDEGFMAWSKNWLDVLKIRSSWALMGNDRIAGFQYLNRYDYGGTTDVALPNYYLFGTTGTRYNGYAPGVDPNPDVTWEKAQMSNIGLNFTVLNRKLSADINYFFQKRTDILITRSASIPDFTGIRLPQENLGKVNNYGWEFQVDWADKIGEVNYNLSANFTQAKNEVVYLDEAANVPEWRKREGHPIDSYIIYPTYGLFKSQEEIDNLTATLKDTKPGDPAYVDTDGNGKIEANDRVRSYTSNVPEIQFGFSGGFDYKGFNMNFLFQGQTKAKMLVYFETHGARPDFFYTQRWTPENVNAKYPRAFSADSPYSANRSGDAGNFEGADLWLHDASFVRLKELELGYTFSKEKLKVGDLKLFVRGTNLFTFFSDIYKLGLDPEAEGYVDFRKSTYPSLKTYSVGLNFNF